MGKSEELTSLVLFFCDGFFPFFLAVNRQEGPLISTCPWSETGGAWRLFRENDGEW